MGHWHQYGLTGPAGAFTLQGDFSHWIPHCFWTQPAGYPGICTGICARFLVGPSASWFFRQIPNRSISCVADPLSIPALGGPDDVGLLYGCILFAKIYCRSKKKNTKPYRHWFNRIIYCSSFYKRVRQPSTVAHSEEWPVHIPVIY